MLLKLCPQDDIERMLLFQLIASHMASMACFARMAAPDTSRQLAAQALGQAQKMSRLFLDIERTGRFYSAVMTMWIDQREHYAFTTQEFRYEDLTSVFEAKARLLIVFLGVYPKPVLERMEPSVDALLAHVEAVTGYEAPEPTTPTILEAAEEPGHGDEDGPDDRDGDGRGRERRVASQTGA